MNRSPDILGPKSDAVRGAQLLLQSKNRRIRGEFLVEGPQAVAAALEASLVRYLYVTVEEYPRYATAAVERVYLVTDAGLAAIAETENPAGVVAVAQIPRMNLEDLGRPSKVLVAVEISDPGNLGTMIRTAAAAGYEAVITTSGSADVWNGKVIRATVGMFTQIKIIPNQPINEVLLWSKSQALTPIATTGNAKLELTSEAAKSLFAEPHLLMIGNEAHGLDSSVLAAAVGVRIPMAPGVESLNAAVAAALCMYTHKFI